MPEHPNPEEYSMSTLTRARCGSCQTPLRHANRNATHGENTMIKHWMFAATLAAVLSVAGCGSHDDHGEVHPHPATVEPTDDAGISRITLTDRAAERIGIQLAEIQLEAGKGVAPYSALLYDASGGEWVYTSPQDMVFKRARIKVDRIEKDKMYLDAGPEEGTKVVSVGAVELFGTELDIGH